MFGEVQTPDQLSRVSNTPFARLLMVACACIAVFAVAMHTGHLPPILSGRSTSTTSQSCPALQEPFPHQMDAIYVDPSYPQIADYCEVCACPPTVGMSLGNTFSRAGVYRNGKHDIIPNSQTASWVAFAEEQRLLVGSSARNSRESNARSTVFDFIRLMGREFSDPMVEHIKAFLPYDIVGKDSKAAISVIVEGVRKTFFPEEIASMILSELKSITEASVGTQIRDVVLTVPASFNDAQRQAMKDAGTIAGLNVRRVLNEPTAAAIAYGLDRIENERIVLVLDMGGKTLKVDLLAIEGGVIEVLASSGNAFLGGQDLTERLTTFVLEQFESRNSSSNTASTDRHAMRRLENEVERAKIVLSTQSQTRVELRNFSSGHDLSVELTRETFTAQCSDLFEQSLKPVQAVLDDANMSARDVSDLLLLGGSAHIPMLRRRLHALLNDTKPLHGPTRPEDAAAVGAAMQGSILSGGDQDTSSVLLLDVDGTGGRGRCAADEFSGTNRQVSEVDEPDMVKTDGRFVYVLAPGGQRLVIARAYPFEHVSVVSATNLSRYGMKPSEMLLDGDSLVVIGSAHVKSNGSQPPDCGLGRGSWEAAVAGAALPLVTLQLWNISDRAAPLLVQTYEMEGRLLAARLVDGYAYLVVDTSSDRGRIGVEAPSRIGPLARLFRGGYNDNDTSYRDNVPLMPAADCRETEQARRGQEGWLSVVSVATKGRNGVALGQVQTTTHAGRGTEVYVSRDNLYVASTRYDEPFPEDTKAQRPRPWWRRVMAVAAPFLKLMTWHELETEAPRWGPPWTSVEVFGLAKGHAAFRHAVSVRGSVLNQFSMDEHRGYFRVATTTVDARSRGRTSGVFVFDAAGKRAGEVAGLAPGEDIFAARFQGDRGYLVTFRQVDPLFALDLSNPSAPYVLGELKIPGWSDYLHPVNSTHLLGLGTAATDEGEVEGVKMALFDVTDPTAPKERYSVVLGGRGSSTTAVHDHRAFLFHPPTGLLAFPVSGATWTRHGPGHGGRELERREHARMDGAVVLYLNERAFELRGLVAHPSHHDRHHDHRCVDPSLRGDHESEHADDQPEDILAREDAHSVYRLVRMAGGGQVVLSLSRRELRVHDLADISLLARIAVD